MTICRGRHPHNGTVRPCALRRIVNDMTRTTPSSDRTTHTLLESIAGRDLAQIEGALAVGDLATARRRVRQIRRAIEDELTPAARDLRLVGNITLTTREIETLQLLTDGSMSAKDVAREFCVSLNTVKTHLKSVYLKLGVHCRGEAIRRARECGFISSPASTQLASPSPEAMPLVKAG